jgi:hypothetical protein
MGKPKFDLSNVGGQPKDWMQREHEKQIESSWWENIWVPLVLVGAPVLMLGGAGGFLYLLLKLAG